MTARRPTAGAKRCRRKFLRIFPGGFRDETYIDWERDYKVAAHRSWERTLSRERYEQLLRERAYAEIVSTAVKIESRTNLLFSFEKMALRDAVRSAAGAQAFASGLYELLYGGDAMQIRFTRWCDIVAALPRKQTRVLTWPLVTVFGFIAQPKLHIFLKPNVTRIAAREYGFPFHYQSKPSWDIYENYLAFATQARRDLRDLRPRDQIDMQSFLWVQGSGEYEE
jgi:hypothetical protein